jgi:hypothetical protein
VIDRPTGSIVLIHFDILHRGSRQAFEKLGDPESPLPDDVIMPGAKKRTFARHFIL